LGLDKIKVLAEGNFDPVSEEVAEALRAFCMTISNLVVLVFRVTINQQCIVLNRKPYCQLD